MRHEDVHAVDGEKIGELVEVYLDKATREPEWLAVDAGLFGMKRVLVPAAGARIEPGAVRVAFAKDVVLDTPDVMDGQVSQDVEERLYKHYGLRYSFERSPTGLPDTTKAGVGGTPAGAAGRWPDVPEEITERPVFLPERSHGVNRHDPGASPLDRFLRIARTSPEAPWFAAAVVAFAASLVAMRMRWQRRTVDLRIAGALLLLMSVTQKQARAIEAQRRQAIEHPGGGDSPIGRIMRLVKKS
jgi:hypothetical protein